MGREVRSEFFGADAMVHARGDAPANPPEVLAVEADGSRYRTNEADAPRRSEEAPPEDRGWRENKVGLIARLERGKEEPDGSWTPPHELVKTCVATTRDIHAFGRDLRTEADRRGVAQAEEVVSISDNGHGIPAMLEREFGNLGLHRVTDFYHSAGRLGEVASIAAGPDDSKRRWKTFFGLRDALWEGKVDHVTRRLKAMAVRRTPRPETLSELDSNPEARALWEHAIYFEKNSRTMDYPEYRRRGWPIASGSVESACGRIGDRVKHARMRWTRKHADAVHAVKAAQMSEDDRWNNRWPGPIPIIEAPLAPVQAN